MLLQLKGVKKYFPQQKGFWGKTAGYVRAVDGIDLSLSEGENLGLVGESGSGKTTVARLITKLYPVDAGAILLDGTDIAPFSPREMRPLRRHVQMVFQDPYSSLDPRFRIAGILAEADRMVHPALGRMGRLQEALEAVGMSESVLNRYPHAFSGGERQRIAIARALMMKPRLLILDEAVSSLDVLIQEQILELLNNLQKSFHLTYLFISHNLRVIRKVCQRIAVMYQGKIVEIAPTDELFKNPLHLYTQELFSSAMTYKSRRENFGPPISDKFSLSDRGNGHFVLD